MSDSPRPDGIEPTQPLGNSYPAYTDPAYASQAPYGPTYQAPAVPNPTQPLPPYSPYGYDPYATGQYGQQYPPGEPPQPPPEPPKSPRWLWWVAAVAVLTVVGLVIALVIVNSSRQQTVVAPLPSMPEPSSTTPTPTPTTTRRTVPPIIPAPTTAPPTESATPGATETVTYGVTGAGRAINITYVDTGSLLQTEFNVMLPWSKEVELPDPAAESASVTVINVGREVTCTVSVNGAVVQQRTGSGLTICSATG
jgi:Mycobacterium membrane protein